MAKDATIEILTNVRHHPMADRLDLVNILGFQCVTQKGLYKGGEKIVYIRPDSILPIEPWTDDYRKYSPKRIKAVKLRQEWSEGVIVPFDILPPEKQLKLVNLEVGEDVSEIIGVVHYEPPAPQDLQAKGYLPYNLGKTDEERFENLIDKLPIGEVVDIFLKVDGQSCSFYYKVDEDAFGVLGRSLELKPEAENNYTSHLKRYDIENKLKEYCKKHNISLCIRGESYGSGIQTMELNQHSKKEKGFAMFSVYLIDEKRYARKGDKFYFLNVAKELEIPIVDPVEMDIELTMDIINKYSTGIEKLNDNPFEGVVVQHSRDSFKIINKHYDSKK